ncbi:MAG: phosphohistidine swiveling domain-containing protein [Oleiphilaceae bacterium]|jgi:phosphohistidine swiveling domain-containing protein
MLCAFSDYKADFHAGKCGGKGKVLAELFQLGFSVPQGFIIFPEAFHNDSLIDEAWLKIKESYYSLKKLGYSNVAVRSSSAVEDSIESSYAGEFESILNISDEDNLQKAILQVYKSRNSSRSQSYSQVRNIKSENAFSVVIQGMINADLSGVIFTVDAVQGKQTIMSGNFVEGIGEGLMSGDVNPSIFSFEKSTQKYSGPSSLQPFSKILFDTANKLEKHFAIPQDIEWAISGDNIYLLQSRPITAVYEPDLVYDIPCENKYLWSNTNVGEAYCDVLTPLTWSIVRRDDINTKKLPGNHPVLRLFFGRLYINLSVQFAILNKFGLKPNAAADELKSVFGSISIPSEMKIESVELSVVDIVAVTLKNVFYGIVNVITEKNFVKQLRDNNAKKCREMITLVSKNKSAAALLDVFDIHVKDVDKTFEFLTINANRMVNKHRQITYVLADKVDADDCAILSSGFNVGAGLESMGPLMGAARLAKGEIDKQLFYQEYGHRCVNEFELASPRPSESVDWIDSFLKESSMLKLTESRIEEMQEERQQAWVRLQATDERAYKKCQRLYQECVQWAQSREMIRSELVRKITVRREIFLTIGKLTDLGNDIFFLTIEEIYRLVRQKDKTVLKKIAARKNTYAMYKKIPAPPYVIYGDYETTRKMEVKNTLIIKGLPGSAGVFEGYVRLLESFEQIDQLKDGEVLVTPSINVGWTMVFPKLGAIITDNGAPLSHAAIIARELGIPAVVSTGYGSAQLNTGDRVRVDGTNGYVEKI